MPYDQATITPMYPAAIQEDLLFPTVPMYDRRENFAKFDLETLFFVFYFQPGTYQQYLAAIELKKKKWKYHRKYRTWFKKVKEGKVASDQVRQPFSIALEYR